MKGKRSRIQKEKVAGVSERGLCCCQVDSVVSIDERGQMVLPKELRDRAHINAGDKLAVIRWEKEGSVCCIALVKAEQFNEMVKGSLGPILKEIIK